jgi:hypothetical protein
VNHLLSEVHLVAQSLTLRKHHTMVIQIVSGERAWVWYGWLFVQPTDSVRLDTCRLSPGGSLWWAGLFHAFMAMVLVR